MLAAAVFDRGRQVRQPIEIIKPAGIRQIVRLKNSRRSYLEKVGRETRRCLAVTLAERIRFGSMVVVSGIATTAAVSTSRFQFRRRQRERGNS